MDGAAARSVLSRDAMCESYGNPLYLNLLVLVVFGLLIGAAVAYMIRNRVGTRGGDGR